MRIIVQNASNLYVLSLILSFIVFVITILVVLTSSEQSKKSNGKHKHLKNDDELLKLFEIDESKDWEVVNRKTERWFELGYGDGVLFPGYGKLYKREFHVWYCDVGSKDKKGLQIIRDVFPLNYEPKDLATIAGSNIAFKWLNNPRDFLDLKTGLDAKNKRRWYLALISAHPTWVETARAIENEEELPVTEDEIVVPIGWMLVRRLSEDWYLHKFSDDYFPGYGKIYLRTFDVWYCEIGSKEKVFLPQIQDRAIEMTIYFRICVDLSSLCQKKLNFELLKKNQGYISLATALDEKGRKRWYFGLMSIEPTYIFTAPRD